MSDYTRANHANLSIKAVCVEHRSVDKPCCDAEKLIFSYRWRAPRKTNDRAWRKVAEGNYLWENTFGQNDQVALGEREQRRNPKHMKSEINEGIFKRRYGNYRQRWMA